MMARDGNFQESLRNTKSGPKQLEYPDCNKVVLPNKKANIDKYVTGISWKNKRKQLQYLAH